MTEIIPAILPEDFDDLREHLALVRGIAPMVQVDIVDGEFAPDPTWPYANDPGGIFERLAAEEEAMPFWKEIDFEMDMMVHRAEDTVHDWLRAGAGRIILHVESDTDIAKVLNEVRTISTHTDSVAYTPVGIALNTTTAIEDITPFFDGDDNTADFVQCMGIERIGYQGQDFDERVLDTIEAIRMRYPQLPISVDGGVDVDTASQLAEAGATRLISGSFIFESGDIAGAIQQLKEVSETDFSEEP